LPEQVIDFLGPIGQAKKCCPGLPTIQPFRQKLKVAQQSFLGHMMGRFQKVPVDHRSMVPIFDINRKYSSRFQGCVLKDKIIDLFSRVKPY
jgi:hypothetical protein